MAEAARVLGYSYIAITDHSKRMSITKGLNDIRLMEQGDEINRVREKIQDIIILKGIEVDILEDGSLDLSDEALSSLDIVLAAVHSKFKLSREKQTRRILMAMDNPHVSAIAHPTGRLIGEREGYQVDMERVMEKALETGCFLELNAQPARLDLNDVNLKLAKDMGIKIAISTDAHNIDSLQFMRYGINQARRGWLESQDVINTQPPDKLFKLIRLRKR
jgi:DNA polymerase (family 10)